MSSDLPERAGVEQVTTTLSRNSAGFPREPERPDYGIDLYVECADDGRPNGRLLGVQVKGGRSYFDETTDEGVVYRGEARHLDYWLRHSLPVILILHNTRDRNSYWVAMTEDAVTRTGAGWKIVVPSGQLLGVDPRAALRWLADGDPSAARSPDRLGAGRACRAASAAAMDTPTKESVSAETRFDVAATRE